MIRVSCAALATILLEGRVLLEINKNRGDVLTPLGGALEFHAESARVLRELGAQFERGADLRLELPDDRLEEFEVWFRERSGRETSPLREVREELVLEHRVLAELRIECLTSRYVATRRVQGTTSRRGLEGRSTMFLFEIHHVVFESATGQTIASAAGQPGSRLRLVSPECVRRGIDMTDGMRIGESATIALEAIEHMS